MKLPFFDRSQELSRLQKAFDASYSTFVCLYGRRRCGKSRLLQTAIKDRLHVYYIGDEREPALQRAALAKEIGRLIAGFDRVTYPSWDDLFERWYSASPPGTILALDEFPFMVMGAPELPGILQKYLDRENAKSVHLALCGSSQRMMFGLVLDATAPLYGRAREILKIEPLNVYYLSLAMGKARGDKVIESYSVWGGIPRYWELALDYSSTFEAVRNLVLNPLSPLYREPDRWLSDQMRDTRQAASLMFLIGQGCHRLSEIAGRLEKPATSLTRPLAMLIELGFIRREIPFGASPRDTKRSLYKIADPFLAFYLSFVEPNRSLLEAGLLDAVAKNVTASWSRHVATIWEELSRQSVPHSAASRGGWGPASRWWGMTDDGEKLEIDIVASALDTDSKALVGEVKYSCSSREIPRILADLKRKASRCPPIKNKEITCALWTLRGGSSGPDVFTADDVIASLA